MSELCWHSGYLNSWRGAGGLAQQEAMAIGVAPLLVAVGSGQMAARTVCPFMSEGRARPPVVTRTQLPAATHPHVSHILSSWKIASASMPSSAAAALVVSSATLNTSMTLRTGATSKSSSSIARHGFIARHQQQRVGPPHRRPRYWRTAALSPSRSSIKASPHQQHHDRSDVLKHNKPLESLALPRIIQGGMGVYVSNWKLANTVSRNGELGVVSGTAMDNIMARQLQAGDPGGHYRRALSHFPCHAVAEELIERYYVEDSSLDTEDDELVALSDEDKAVKASQRLIRFSPVEMHTLHPSEHLLKLTVASNFAEVWLAKDGHSGLVGMNLLTKIELPTIPSLYGGMLAGVDFVLMGAGIPRAIPDILDKLTTHAASSLLISVQGAEDASQFQAHFDPRKLFEGSEFLETPLQRPRFLPVVASVLLAKALLKSSAGKGIDGFVVELPQAGGHNAPPRGKYQVSETGEPVYGPKDEVNLDVFAALGKPFWLAGGFGDPERLRTVMAHGAQGVQVGTLFAFSRESGFAPDIKQRVWEEVRAHDLHVYTDPLLSPTGFPFKVVELEGTMSDKENYEARPRACTLGYLRVPYVSANGKVLYRCASEPVASYQAKGGALADTVDRKCLCNGLLANVGLGNVMRVEKGQPSAPEGAIVTAGDDINHIRQFLPSLEAVQAGKTLDGYSAVDVLAYLKSGLSESESA